MDALLFFFEVAAVSLPSEEASAASEVVSALPSIFPISVSFPVEESNAPFPADAFCAAVRCPVVFDALFCGNVPVLFLEALLPDEPEPGRLVADFNTDAPMVFPELLPLEDVPVPEVPVEVFGLLPLLLLELLELVSLNEFFVAEASVEKSSFNQTFCVPEPFEIESIIGTNTCNGTHPSSFTSEIIGNVTLSG